MIFIYASIMFLSLPQNSVGEVKSSAYQLMLDTLLHHSVPEISVHKISPDDEIYWLDVREKKEFEVSKIPGANWVGYEEFSLDSVNEIPKNAKIIVYCSVGYRSEKVSEKLINADYTQVSNLYGGIFEWKNQGKSVINNADLETDKVHGFSKLWGIWLDKGEAVY